ncbi:Hsp20/alpha crystallin family protein [Tabrizicola sp.]|uniref:Hsp20/alpha crystallin family protein n=1 Tax=Tabrizicola sp. TaxID=2005166 RepID=UPI00286A8AEE|nr:Hsp20/alpha crystallin family protein [Tabrizicola sp.]
MVEKSSASGFWPSLYDPFRLAGSRLADWLAPASEASHGDDGYRISMELPGVSEDEIHLSVEDGLVQITGEKKTSREEKGETWYFSERQFGSFSRSFRLPADADPAGVKAQMKDGVLTVTIPKRPAAAAAAKRVPIAKG